MTKSSLIAALAPTPEPFETEWSQRTLAGILAADREAAARKRKAPKAAASTRKGDGAGTTPRASKKPAAGRSAAKPAGAAAAGGAAAAQADPAGQPPSAPQAQPATQASGPRAEVPGDCRGLEGVSRDVCVQCADVPIYKRVVCEQKVFWSLCKGKRLFTDAYCQQNQSLGRGEGG